MPSKLLAKVVGVGMYGDPLFTPGLAIDRDYRLLDPKTGVAWATDLGNQSVPKSLGSVTYDACLPGDPVCQAPNAATLALCMADNSACPHTRYVTDDVTEPVADFLNRGLPPSSVWPTITSAKAPDGRVGTSYSWTPMVRPTARTSYTWSVDGILPPGLIPSSTTGGLAGTPTMAGIYDFSVTATTIQLRTATQHEEVIINSGGPLSTSPSSLPAATAGTVYKTTLSGSGVISLTPGRRRVRRWITG
jgi:Putative Ig domain